VDLEEKYMSQVRVVIPLFEGFEEIEAITVIDVLRRAQIEVTSAGLDEGTLKASRGTFHLPDRSFREVSDEIFDAVVLPGGPGVAQARKNSGLLDFVRKHHQADKWIAAICAAPTILQDAGVLGERTRLTAHPSVREEFAPSQYSLDHVVVDQPFVTSRSAGTAMIFAFKLVEVLKGKDAVDEVNRGVLANLEMAGR
jgi:protein deglycase